MIVCVLLGFASGENILVVQSSFLAASRRAVEFYCPCKTAKRGVSDLLHTRSTTRPTRSLRCVPRRQWR